MNTQMYLHPLTAKHLATVKDDLGYKVYGPIQKGLACGDNGSVSDPQMLIKTDVLT